MNINIIAAISKNRVIGNKGKIPWNIKKDLKYFQKLTTQKNSAVLMGFNTWKSLPTFPNPLPNRGNIVVTRNNAHQVRALIYKDLNDINFSKDLFQTYYKNIWICGGQSIYEYYIDKPYINKIYLTEIDENFEGDTFFPKIPDNYYLKKRGNTYYHQTNALNFIPYNFNIYQNKSMEKNEEEIYSIFI